MASAVGATFLRVTAGQAHPETGEADGIAWAVAYLRKCAPVSDKYGITQVYENHGKQGAWEYIDFSNPLHIFLKIAQDLTGTSIGINFDTPNILVSGHDTTLDILEAVIDKVKTIRVAETGIKGKMDPVPIGSGIVPFTDIFRFLKARNFAGWLCLEEWSNNGAEGVKEAVDFVKKTWAEA